MNGNQNPGYIKPLRYWVQLVTPLVYDDSLSLYETMGKVVKKLNDVIEVVNPLGAGIEDTVKKYLEQYKVQWEAELREFEQDIQNQINANNTALNGRIDKLTSDTEKEIQDFEAEMTQTVNDFNAQILEKYATVVALIRSTDEANRVWTLAQIAKVMEDLTGNFPPVVDPTDGKTESIQTALNHMWDAWRENALTAGEYDALELTAEEYDSKELTAIAYDRYGKILLDPGAQTVSVQGVPFNKDVVNMEVLKNGKY